MPFRLVTLDCANTLLRGSWDPVGFALEAARDAGLCLPARAARGYSERLRRHYPQILAANRTGDEAAVRREYVALAEGWLDELGVESSLAATVVEAGERLLTDPTSGVFEPFPDTLPFLDAARAKGVRLAVVSNWDVSLPRVLRAHGLADRVDAIYASLVVGAEKPDPTMLRLAMAEAGARPDETLHIGDDPEDDLGAAANAGVSGVLIDRASVSPLPSGGDGLGVRGTIHTLLEALPWID